MAQGVEVFISEGFVEVDVLDPAKRPEIVSALVLAARDAGETVSVDTGGARRSYVVSRKVAEASGIVRARRPSRAKAKDKAEPVADKDGTDGDE